MAETAIKKPKLSLRDYYLNHRVDLVVLEEDVAAGVKDNLAGIEQEAETAIVRLWPYDQPQKDPRPIDKGLVSKLTAIIIDSIKSKLPKLHKELIEDLITVSQAEWEWQWKLYHGPYLDPEAASKMTEAVNRAERLLIRLARQAGIYEPYPLEFAHEQITSPAPWDGTRIDERLPYLCLSTKMRIQGDLTCALSQGDDIKRIIKKLKPILGQYAHRAEVIARTETLRAANHVSQVFINQNADVISGVECFSTLDDRTCMECAALDGVKFYYPPLPRGGKSIDAMPHYPMHPQCRCTVVPFTDLWQQMGIEPPPDTRASMYGPVRHKTFDSWLRAMEKAGHTAIPLKVLGPERYALWQARKVTLRKLSPFSRDQFGHTVAKRATLFNLRRKIAGPPPKPKPVSPKKVPKGPLDEPVKTVEQAQDWAVKNLNLESCDYTGLSAEQAHEVNTTLYKLKQKYPKTHLKTIDMNVSNPRWYACVGGKKHLHLKLDYFGNKDYFEQSYKRCIDTRYHPPVKAGVSAIQAVTTHEYAHTLAHSWEMTGRWHWGIQVKKPWDEIPKLKSKYTQAWRKLYRQGNPDWVKQYISEYAQENSDEFLAEAFVQAELAPTVSPFAQQVMEIVNEAMQAGKGYDI